MTIALRARHSLATRLFHIAATVLMLIAWACVLVPLLAFVVYLVWLAVVLS